MQPINVLWVCTFIWQISGISWNLIFRQPLFKKPWIAMPKTKIKLMLVDQIISCLTKATDSNVQLLSVKRPRFFHISIRKAAQEIV
jgi:hypothetical protein